MSKVSLAVLAFCVVLTARVLAQWEYDGTQVFINDPFYEEAEDGS